MKADLKALGRNKSPGVYGLQKELFQATETETVKILTRICQLIRKTKQCPTDLAAFHMHPNRQERRCQGAG